MSQSRRNAAPEKFSVIKPEELAGILDSHAVYAAGHGGKRAKLVSFDLSHSNLVNRNLAHAKLSGSLLCGAVMRFANLEDADLYCADLRNVDARYVNFTRADMRGITLEGSNLAHAKLDFADMRAGRLVRSGFWGIDSVVDHGSSAAGCNFSHSSLRGTSFEGVKLDGANFTGAIIHATNFKGAKLTGAVFDQAVFTDIDLADLRVPREALQNCVLPPSEEALAKAPHLLVRLESHQRCIETNTRSGWSANFDGEDLRPIAAQIGQFKLTAVSARRAVATGMDFSCAELQGANFEGADLRGSKFVSADLRGVNFRGAKLYHASFAGADLRPLDFAGGKHCVCDFTGAEYTQEQLAEAVLK